MRIISGTHKGRQFSFPKNLNIRPTTDFAKEALFNILQNRIIFEGASVLDLFSGSGNISYEFASRGCSEIISVEKNPKCCNFIKKTIKKFNFTNIHIVNMDVFMYLNLCQDTFALIFADPPFKLKNIERVPLLVFEKNLLKESGLLIVEHSSQVNFAGRPEHSGFQETRKYGAVNFSIFGNQ
jgi:16S rRNA (guanine(966)-N(2))-methyltransferase RsmD